MSSSAFALIGDTFQARIGIWKCWFLRRGENRSTRGKTSRSREENQQQTQPTYDAGSGNWTRDTLVGGERSHHCTIPAPLIVFGINNSKLCHRASFIINQTYFYWFFFSISILKNVKVILQFVIHTAREGQERNHVGPRMNYTRKTCK